MKLTSLFAVVANLVVASLMVGCVVVPSAGEDIEITDDECLNTCNEQRDACDADYMDCEALCDANRERGCEDLYLEAMDCQAESADRCVVDECEAVGDEWATCYVGE
jgi:hypothetical protein